MTARTADPTEPVRRDRRRAAVALAVGVVVVLAVGAVLGVRGTDEVAPSQADRLAQVPGVVAVGEDTVRGREVFLDPRRPAAELRRTVDGVLRTLVRHGGGRAYLAVGPRLADGSPRVGLTVSATAPGGLDPVVDLLVALAGATADGAGTAFGLGSPAQASVVVDRTRGRTLAMLLDGPLAEGPYRLTVAAPGSAAYALVADCEAGPGPAPRLARATARLEEEGVVVVSGSLGDCGRRTELRVAPATSSTDPATVRRTAREVLGPRVALTVLARDPTGS